MKRKTRVYIAGKLNSDAVGYLHNVHKMMNTAEAVRLAGFSVFIPAIDLLCGIKHGYTKYEDYFENGQSWLMAADAMYLVPGWESSKGTIKEMELARENNIPIFEDMFDLIEAENNNELQRPFVDEMEFVEDSIILDKIDDTISEIQDVLKEAMKDAE